jgi:hypothetical protein
LRDSGNPAEWSASVSVVGNLERDVRNGTVDALAGGGGGAAEVATDECSLRECVKHVHGRLLCIFGVKRRCLAAAMNVGTK